MIEEVLNQGMYLFFCLSVRPSTLSTHLLDLCHEVHKAACNFHYTSQQEPLISVEIDISVHYNAGKYVK